MYTRSIIFVASLALAISSAGWAQNPGFGYAMTYGPIETKAVTGVPYSATAITTFSQMLSDGTHISRTIQAQMARDSMGRTRREESITVLGPLSGGGNEQHLVNINDPVAQTHYILQPDQQVAIKAPLPGLGGQVAIKAPMQQSGAAMAIANPAGGGGPIATINVRQGIELSGAKLSAVPTGDVMWVSNGAPGAAVQFPDKKPQVEDLGDQVIEGVHAHGRLEKRTIAAGEIGNDRPIEVSSETWYSDELQTVVLSKRTDPRVGDTEYRLTNISRVEPAASLFEIPSGYTVKEPGKLP